MYLALYRKYRPKTFSEIIGQEYVVKILKNALIYAKTSHAYLFCGPRGIGKTTIARLLAKAVNCEERKNSPEPCNQCFACREINEGKSIDLLEIDAASNRGINEIRDLREKVKFTPSRAKFKVFIIDEVHMLTMEAFNALLKTLEEPPAHCIFILATTAPHKVPATILSRCQRFDFRKLSRFEIEKHLEKIAESEKIKVDKKAISLVAKEAQGSSRDALTILGQIISLEDEEITYNETKAILGISDLSKIIELVDFVIEKDAKKSLHLINQLVEEGQDMNQFAKELLEYLRKLLLLKIDLDFNKLSEISLTKEELEAAVEQIQKIKDRDFLVKLIDQIIKAKKEIEISSLSQLPLEIAVIESIGKIEESKSFQQNEGEKNRIKNPADAGQDLTPDILAIVTLSDIQKNWLKVQELVRQKDFSLFVFLRSSSPFDFKDGYLHLACKYNLHKERLEDLKNRRLLEEILSEVMKSKILIKCRIASHLPKNFYNSNRENKSLIKNPSGNKKKDLVDLAVNILEAKAENEAPRLQSRDSFS